jgi:hypothetical protein
MWWCEDKRMLTLHLYKFGLMPGYEVWMHHGEWVYHRTALVADRSSDDRMDEMFDAIRLELETNFDDPPTPEVQKFFDMLRALEESLHEHTTLIVLAFVTCLTAIKSMFTFSNKCYMELLHLISDVLPIIITRSQNTCTSQKNLSALGMEYKKIDVYKDNCMLFYKEHKDETKCLKCGKSRFVEVVWEGDDEDCS